MNRKRNYFGILILLLLFKPVVAQETAPQPQEATSEKAETTTEEKNKKKALPWENLTPKNLPGKKIQNVKEYMTWLGVDASQWNNFYHDQTLGASDEEYINRLLLRLQRIGAESLIEYRQPEFDFAKIAADPAIWQGETYALQGIVTHVETVPLPPELADIYDFKETYRATLQLAKPEEQAIICLDHVPATWLKEPTKLHEPVSCEAVFIKTSPRENAATQLAFVSKHLAWHPVANTEIANITPELVALGSIGLDVSLFDKITSRNFLKLGEPDTEPFYEMLRVAKNMTVKRLPQLSDSLAISIPDTLAKPNEQHGKLVTIEGRVERVQKINLDSKAWRKRLGMQHYFELYVFVPVGEAGIKWSRSKDDPNPRIFTNSFPVTVCVPEVPETLEKNPNKRELVRVQGAVFKVWSYRPQGDGNDLPQPSPLVIGNNVTILPPVKLQSDAWDKAGTVILLVLVLAIGWLISQQFQASPKTLQPPKPEKLELPKSNETTAPTDASET